MCARVHYSAFSRCACVTFAHTECTLKCAMWICILTASTATGTQEDGLPIEPRGMLTEFFSMHVFVEFTNRYSLLHLRYATLRDRENETRKRLAPAACRAIDCDLFRPSAWIYQRHVKTWYLSTRLARVNTKSLVGESLDRPDGDEENVGPESELNSNEECMRSGSGIPPAVDWRPTNTIWKWGKPKEREREEKKTWSNA